MKTLNLPPLFCKPSALWEGHRAPYSDLSLSYCCVRLGVVPLRSCAWMKITGPFLFILATLMIDAIGVGIVFPIMPDLMERVGAGSTAEGALLGGVMMSAYAAAMFLFGPVVGSLSDAFGRWATGCCLWGG